MELVEQQQRVIIQLDRSACKFNYIIWTKTIMWFIYNLTLHYIDFLVDILLCFHSNNLRLQLFFIVLPNLLICCLSVSTNLIKLNSICFFILTSFFNLQCFLTLTIWLYYNYKRNQSNNTSKMKKSTKLDFIELEYVLLILYLFQVLCNNVPQLYLQSYYYLHSKLNTSGYKLIQLIKIGLCLLKISLVTVKFKKYFFLNEFHLVLKLSKTFLIIKFLSNLFTLVIRLAPVIYLIYEYSLVCSLLIVNKLLVCFIQTYLTLFLNTNVKFSILSMFWYVVISCLRFCVFIDNFTFKSLVQIYNLVENCILFSLIFISMNNFKKSFLICFLILLINLINMFNEYLCWKYCFTNENEHIKMKFNDLFNKWLLQHKNQENEAKDELNMIQINTNGDETKRYE